MRTIVLIMREKYGLFQRETQKGKFWYFYYYPVANSNRRLKKSTGKTTKWEAKQFVEAFFHNQEEKKERVNQLTLKDFTTNFFCWDSCDWIKSQHEKGKAFDVSIAKIRRSHLINYIWPEFGDEQFLAIGTPESKLKTVYIEKWLSNLQYKKEIKQKGKKEKAVVYLPMSNQTKNHLLYTFKIVMRWAYKNELLKYNPLEAAEPASRKEYKKKDILSLEELKKLFPADQEKLIEIWGSTYWATLFLLMITSGMRSQEIRALFWGDILFDDGIVLIQRAVKLHGEIGSTKSNYDKAVYLPNRTMAMLKRWHAESPFKENHHLLFYGNTESEPLPRKKLLLEIKDRLSSFDIQGKKITPHCLRTTYNTYMRQNISEFLLRLQLGHKSEAMTDRYDRGAIIDKLLPFQGEREKINSFWG